MSPPRVGLFATSVGVAVVVSLVPCSGMADEQPPQSIELAVTLGYAVPIGDSERGGRVSDTTFGVVPLAIDMGYRFVSRVGVAARVQYGIGVPTLCQTAGDCVSSLGTDVAAVLEARVYLPEPGPFAPRTEVGIGYEWLTTRRSDSGAHSKRAYSGPVPLWLEFVAPLRLAGHWLFGPAVGIAVGTFTARSLETNVASTSGDVPERGMHAWISLGGRLEHAF